MKHPMLHAAFVALSDGPPDFPERDLVLKLDSLDAEITFKRVRYAYFPGPGKPEFVLVWAETHAHVFGYHNLDYIRPGPVLKPLPTTV